MLRMLKCSVRLHELTCYILTRGLFLTALLLFSALTILFCSHSWLANWYADYLLTMASILFGASLIGPLLLEDVLRRIG